MTQTACSLCYDVSKIKTTNRRIYILGNWSSAFLTLQTFLSSTLKQPRSRAPGLCVFIVFF